MASDEEISEEITKLFKNSNPNSFNSLNEVILHLQSKLGFDLSNKIDFIRNRINLLFTPLPPQQPPPPPVVSRPTINPNPTATFQVVTLPQQQQQAPSSGSVVSRPFTTSINPNPNFNLNFAGANVVHQSHVSGGQQHVFYGQSYFPSGPTEINFGQRVGEVVVNDYVSSPTAKDSNQKPKRRGGSGGLNKLCGVTPQLQTIVGQPTMPRTEIVRQLWAYIRKNNLQDPSNKRKIICNDELRLVFEVDCTDMFQMNKLLAKHILHFSPLDSSKDSGQQSKKLKTEESQVQHSEPALIKISEPLAKFFGVSEMKMLQSDVYKRIDEYIKTDGLGNLQDPLNSTVTCDPKVRELLGCESITPSAIRDAVARNHLSHLA